MILAPLWRDFIEFLGHQEKFKGCIFEYTHIQKKVCIHPRHHCLGMWMVDADILVQSLDERLGRAGKYHTRFLRAGHQDLQT